MSDRGSTASAWLCSPPYLELRSVADPITPGDVLVITGDADAPTIRSAAELIRTAPWLPIAIREPAPARAVSRAFLHWIRAIPFDPAFLWPAVEGGKGLAALSAAAVESQPIPDGADLCHYVTVRCADAGLAHLVHEALARPERRTMPIRTLSRRLRQSGRLGLVGWRRLLALAQFAAIARVHKRTASALVRPRLRGSARVIAGVPLTDLQTRVGWRWLVEAALIHNQYERRVLATEFRGSEGPMRVFRAAEQLREP